jgi:hypothetical protein
MAGPVTQLVKAGSVKTVRVFKGLERGHRNEVPAHRVVGLTLAFAKICAGDRYEILRVRVALVQIEGCHFASEALFWKAVALGNIEHGVLFEKRDMAHFVRVGHLLDLGNEIHLDPVFSFADDSADVEGLFECEPTLGCVPVPIRK